MVDSNLSMEDRHAAFVAGMDYGTTQAGHDKFIAWCDGYNKGLAEGMERGRAMAWPQTPETG